MVKLIGVIVIPGVAVVVVYVSLFWHYLMHHACIMCVVFWAQHWFFAAQLLTCFTPSQRPLLCQRVALHFGPGK
jgi:hypothetical protein